MQQKFIQLYCCRGITSKLFKFEIWTAKTIGWSPTGSQKHTHWSLVVSRFQGIEQLKKEERRWAKKTKWMNMRAVFGHPFSLLWFSPFSTPDHGKAETYQYVVWELGAENEPTGSKPKWERGEERVTCTPTPPDWAQLWQCLSWTPTQPWMAFHLLFVLPTKCAQRVLFCLECIELQRKRIIFRLSIMFVNNLWLIWFILSYSSCCW